MKKIIQTKYGKICGVPTEKFTVYKGVPFAKPPVGELRWRAPQSLAPWEGVLEADHFPAKAIQGEQNEGFYGKEFYCIDEFKVPVSEDCLYLNIWVPEHQEGEKLPVAMWIHGGAFMSGSGSEPEFDGEAFAKQGVILVTVQYRLGIMGFLALPELAEEDENHSTGNYGMQDQIAALKWIHENITDFGGNPNQIIVMGQSAGAMSVQALVSSPVTENLIAGAIIQSGASYEKGLSSGISLERAYEVGETIRKKASELAHIDTIEGLRTLPADMLMGCSAMAFAELVQSWGMQLPFGPTIDGYVLKENYNKVVDENQIKKIPYLMGCNLDDMMVEPGQKGLFYEGTCLLGDKLIEKQNYHPYLYYFTRKLPGDEAGAFHSAELWYMFGTLDRCWRPLTEADQELSRRMVQYWCNFIKWGDPNAKNLPEWNAYDGTEASIQMLDII